MVAANQIIQQCKETLTRQYGKRLKGVILYGSMALGQASPDSDIDLLVLPEAPLDHFTEVRDDWERARLEKPLIKIDGLE